MNTKTKRQKVTYLLVSTKKFTATSMRLAKASLLGGDVVPERSLSRSEAVIIGILLLFSNCLKNTTVVSRDGKRQVILGSKIQATREKNASSVYFYRKLRHYGTFGLILYADDIP